MRKFNPEKELRKIQNGNRNKIILFVLSLLVVSVISYSFALYQVRYSKRIIYTKVAPFSNRDLELAIYVDGKQQNHVPDKDEEYKFAALICDNSNVLSKWNEEKWELELLSTISLPNKCNAYFINKNSEDIKIFQYNGTDGSDGSEQEYVIPKTGLYKIELWGAAGGATTLSSGRATGGAGAYTSGVIKLNAEEKLYFYIGGKGQDGLGSSGSNNLRKGGFNGGGSGGERDNRVPSGGGATDVRLEKGDTWDDFKSLKSRIIVAGAGGGSGISKNGSVGGLNGDVQANLYGYNGSQTAGGAVHSGSHYAVGYPGGFGFGGTAWSYVAGAGGSGYYGGGAGAHITPSSSGGGGGGSSFISGHPGCDAIDNENSTDSDNIIHTGQPNHYSNKVFNSTIMIDGNGYVWNTAVLKGEYVGMPTLDDTGVMAGNTGNGYAKITYLGPQ